MTNFLKSSLIIGSITALAVGGLIMSSSPDTPKHSPSVGGFEDKTSGEIFMGKSPDGKYYYECTKDDLREHDYYNSILKDKAFVDKNNKEYPMEEKLVKNINNYWEEVGCKYV